MCGICGVVNRNAAPVDASMLGAMCAALTHRGPDEDGTLCDGHVGLAMRRLRIIDLSTGSQPIYNEDGRIGIVFNGEIYNYRPLREQLIAQGHQFRTESDTEVIVHLYEQGGPGAMAQLNGMFALAIWDAAAQRLVLARDRTAQKPLFYHVGPQGLTFASELKSLLQAPHVPRTVNPQAVYHYLSLQYVPGDDTILQGVKQLPPGHVAVWNGDSLTVERYWQRTYTPKAQRPYPEWVALTRQTVREAVQRQMMSDVPLGAYLSGGVDSSIIVAAMAEFSTQPVKTFSIGFDVDTYSETSHAARIAQKFDTEHHEFTVTAQQVTDALADVVWYADQPLADTSCLATYQLARLTRQHVTVALTGDGGDEAFAGYTRYVLDRLLRLYRAVPRPLRDPLANGLGRLLPDRPDIPTDKNIAAGVKRLTHAANTSHKASILAWGSFFTHSQKQALCEPDWLATVPDHHTDNLLIAAYDAAPADNALDRTLYADFVRYLADDLMVKADRMSMAHGLETRAPFLDDAVLDLSGAMPPDVRIRGLTQKRVLRDAFADVLPDENVKRVKRGFGMPVGVWLRGHMRGYARDVLLSEAAQSRGMFRPDAVRALLDEHDAHRADHGQRIWALLVLELWHRAFIDGA